MNRLHIVYDDREKFPWLLYAGAYLYAKYRTHKGATWGMEKLQKVLDACYE